MAQATAPILDSTLSDIPERPLFVCFHRGKADVSRPMYRALLDHTRRYNVSVAFWGRPDIAS
jgi:acyl-CoA synthetase (AMP-forming)/AMP-acid ligase II